MQGLRLIRSSVLSGRMPKHRVCSAVKLTACQDSNDTCLVTVVGRPSLGIDDKSGADPAAVALTIRGSKPIEDGDPTKRQ